MNWKQKNIVSSFLIVLLMVIAVVYYFFYRKEPWVKLTDLPKQIRVSNGCLANDETVNYEIKKEKTANGEGVAIVTVRDKNSQKEKIKFQIDILQVEHYHPIELHKCNIYAAKSFNYDYVARKPLAGYRAELWKYDYLGNAEIIVLLDEDLLGGLKGYKYFFNSDFRVSPNEKYLVLEKSYLGKDDYALVIKDLETKEDLFVLKLQDILAQNPEILPGSISLGSWTKDGKYLRGDIFDGALDKAYYQIEAGAWKTEIYPSPSDLLAGVERAINYEKWHLAYVDIPTFTGIQEVYEQIIEKAKKEGKQKNLYVYNLVTKEKIKIASAEPEWRFNINWLSDTELQYELPSGEKKIYIR